MARCRVINIVFQCCRKPVHFCGDISFLKDFQVQPWSHQLEINAPILLTARSQVATTRLQNTMICRTGSIFSTSPNLGSSPRRRSSWALPRWNFARGLLQYTLQLENSICPRFARKLSDHTPVPSALGESVHQGPETSGRSGQSLKIRSTWVGLHLTLFKAPRRSPPLTTAPFTESFA